MTHALIALAPPADVRVPALFRLRADVGLAARRAPVRLKIYRDPSDARRTVLCGSFAEVCAALDRLVASTD